MTSIPVLEVEGLKKSYVNPLNRKKVPALNGVSFQILPGTITGFLGANGAGKTTSIKCVLELAFADAGSITYFGKKGLTKEAKSRIGFLPERPYFYDYLTGREFLKFYASISGRVSKKDLPSRIKQLLERVGLAHAGDRPLRGYSKGMLQRIGIAQALIHRPEFIILDEPMTGLDPDGRHEVREIMREVAGQGTAVFFSSHLLPDAEALCEYLVILKKGELIYQGRTESLVKKAEKGWKIVYESAATGARETLKFDEISQMQIQIDKLRSEKNMIVEVGTERASLEEVFVKIAFDKNKTPEASL